MYMVDLIRKKRNGGELSAAEIRHLVQGYAKGEIPDYQMSAWAMAVYFQGMTSRETADLTLEMVQSGEKVDLSAIQGRIVDKHSTGGVGDTTTLILAPLVAAAGVTVAKLSGRGLGHTGGTIDKLESFSGFSTSLSKDEFVHQVNRIGVAVTGQTADITPADKQLYSLRDVTATVDSIPLIASSIMSKKIAAGADAIVLDVKTGKGAFMKDKKQAIRLAQTMVDIGNRVGRRAVAIISDMNQPLGLAVGNALEVREAIETLKGEGPQDLTELCLTLGAQMVVLSGKATSPLEARNILEQKMRDGTALEKFGQLIASQGGDAKAVTDPDRFLAKAQYQVEVSSPKTGFISALEAEKIGLAAMLLGAGRETKEATIDYAVGLVLNKKVGDPVHIGETVAVLHANDKHKLQAAKDQLLKAVTYDTDPVASPDLIQGEVTEDGVFHQP